LQVLELLLAVEEAEIVELHGRPRLPQVADPEREGHEERRRRERAVAIDRLVVLHRARELADLPELDVHLRLGTPHTDQRTVDFGHLTIQSAARRSRGSRSRRRRSPRSSWRA